MKEQIKTKEFNILDISTLKNDVLLLQKHYEEKGYFLALANSDDSLMKKLCDAFRLKRGQM